MSADISDITQVSFSPPYSMERLEYQCFAKGCYFFSYSQAEWFSHMNDPYVHGGSGYPPEQHDSVVRFPQEPPASSAFSYHNPPSFQTEPMEENGNLVMSGNGQNFVGLEPLSSSVSFPAFSMLTPQSTGVNYIDSSYELTQYSVSFGNGFAAPMPPNAHYILPNTNFQQQATVAAPVYFSSLNAYEFQRDSPPAVARKSQPVTSASPSPGTSMPNQFAYSMMQQNMSTISSSSKSTKPARTKSANRRIKCTYERCCVTVCSEKSLARHLNNHLNPREKMHKCPVKGCSYSSDRKNSIDRHLNVHAKEYLFFCPVKGCINRYKSSSGYRRHMNTHRASQVSNDVGNGASQ